jgi:hypothetical protein
MRKMRNAYNILVEKPEGKRALEKHKRKLENNIWILWELGGKVWRRFIWFRAGTSGGIL